MHVLDISVRRKLRPRLSANRVAHAVLVVTQYKVDEFLARAVPGTTHFMVNKLRLDAIAPSLKRLTVNDLGGIYSHPIILTKARTFGVEIFVIHSAHGFSTACLRRQVGRLTHRG
jgi:hypothetical protein